MFSRSQRPSLVSHSTCYRRKYRTGLPTIVDIEIRTTVMSKRKRHPDLVVALGRDRFQCLYIYRSRVEKCTGGISVVMSSYKTFTQRSKILWHHCIGRGPQGTTWNHTSIECQCEGNMWLTKQSPSSRSRPNQIRDRCYGQQTRHNRHELCLSINKRVFTRSRKGHTWLGSKGVGSAEHRTASLHSIKAFPDHGNDWSWRHVLDQTGEERLRFEVLIVCVSSMTLEHVLRRSFG